MHAVPPPELEESDICRSRTSLFTLGVILTALHALLGWLIGAALLAISRGRLPALRERLEGQGLWIYDAALTWAGVAGAVSILFCSLQLVACGGAWSGSRGWTWTLLVTSVVGCVSSGPVSLVISAVTVFGAVQVLDQSRPYPAGD